MTRQKDVREAPSELTYCKKTGLPYSFNEIKWTPSIMRGWIHYGKCPFCGEKFIMEGCQTNDPTWGGRRTRGGDNG